MIRLPMSGGVISTEGFFLKYDGGVTKKENSIMGVSRGRGHYKIPLRINNRIEIAKLILKSN